MKKLDRVARLAEIDAEMVAIVDALLDAGNDTRPPLIAQRADLVAERDALHDEIAELAERQAAADREKAEIAVEATVATVKALEAERRQAHNVYTEALTTRRRFLNAPRRGDTAQATMKRAELDAAIIEAKAVLEVASAKVRRAADARDEAQAALDSLLDYEK